MNKENRKSDTDKCNCVVELLQEISANVKLLVQMVVREESEYETEAEEDI